MGTGNFDLVIEHDVEDDGRLMAAIPALVPGCAVYAETSDESVKEVVVLALHVIASRVARGEVEPLGLSVRFTLAAEGK